MWNPAVELPVASERRIAVHVSADALRQVRGGHPWIWDGSVVRAGDAGHSAGDLAVVFDDKRRFAAIGLWDPHAPIRVRVLHHGEPRPIDDDFFTERLLDAHDRRQRLHDDPQTTGYRLVHGENDRLPGLVVDRYGDTLVVRLDTVAWLPHLRRVIEPLVELEGAERVVLRVGRNQVDLLPEPISDAMTLVGDPPSGPVLFEEHGLQFRADVEHGQKTGHFLDQRDNRRLVGGRSNGADVLDVFCNTGGFSVHAAAGGARSVVSVDSSRHAIEATKQHIETNRALLGFGCRHEAFTDDAFAALERLAVEGARFDLIVVDPPSFAPNAASVGAAERAYRRLTELAVSLLSPGATLFQASCSSRITAGAFRDLVLDEIRATGHVATGAISTGHAIDHPVGFEHGAYLKAVIAEVHPR